MSQPVHEFAAPALPAEDEALAGLVERARAGDRAAFAALFERYHTRICRYLARLVGDDDLGRDLAQRRCGRALADVPYAIRSGFQHTAAAQCLCESF